MTAYFPYTVFYLSQNGSKSYLPFSFFYIYVKTKYDTLKWFLLKSFIVSFDGFSRFNRNSHLSLLLVYSSYLGTVVVVIVW
jgi:hypothetical protein